MIGDHDSQTIFVILTKLWLCQLENIHKGQPTHDSVRKTFEGMTTNLPLRIVGFVALW